MTTLIAGLTLVFWSGVLAGISFLTTASLGLYSNFVNPAYFKWHKRSTAVTIPLILIHITIAIAANVFAWLP